MKTKEANGTFGVIDKLVKQLVLISFFLITSRYILTSISLTLFRVEDPWQHLWDWVIDTFGDDPFTYHVYGTTLVNKFI